MKLSVVVPVYNKENAIKTSLTGVFSALTKLDYKFEVIAVNDGSKDRSLRELKQIKLEYPQLTIIHKKVNAGKGAALRAGFARAKGEYIGFIDCGLDIMPLSLIIAGSELEKSYDAIAASRYLRASVYETNIIRSVMSQGFNIARDILFSPTVRDTQVALKIYRREVIRSILPLLEEDRWLLDLEIFQWMAYLGYKNIKQVPVIVNMNAEGDNSESATIKGLKDSILGLLKLSLRMGRLSGSRKKRILAKHSFGL